MNKSWFVGIVIFLTLLLVGTGVYFFFPQARDVVQNVTQDEPLFGNIDSNGSTSSNPTTPTSTSTLNTDTPVSAEPEILIGYSVFKLGDYTVSSVQPLDFKTSTTSTSTLIMSIGKGSGLVRLYDPQTKTTSIVGNINIPNIIRSEFTQSGRFVIVQSQDKDVLKTFVLRSDPRTPFEERFFTPVLSSTSIDSFFVDGNMAYFIEHTQSGSEVYEYNPLTNKKTLLMRSFLRDIYGYARDGRIFIGTKPAQNTQGFLFELDRQNGSVEKVTSGIGLTGIPNQKGDALMSMVYFGSFSQTNLINISSKETASLGMQTFKEKCVPDVSTQTFMFCGVPETVGENAPDFWYMGKASLNDSLAIIDTASGAFDSLPSPDEQVDVLYPYSSRHSGIITFINKKDMRPWIITIE